MNRTLNNLSRLFAIGALAALGACGGGGESGAGSGTPGTPAPAPAPAPAPTPAPPPTAFSGFDFTVTSGTFWEYRWDYLSQSGDSSGTSTTRDQGRFWVVLGAPQSVAGINMYAVEVLGKSQPADGGRGFAPRWKYLAMSGGKLLGSTDGTRVETIFDSRTGRWPGGGFFFQIDPTRLTTAQDAMLSNTWLSTSAVSAGRALSTSQCENFPGIGVICGGDVSQTLREFDYFKAGSGPVGYYYKNSASFSGGGYLSFANWEHHLGKVTSSFDNGTLPFVSESSSAHASPAAAQAVQRGQVVRADVAVGDPATNVTVSANGGSLVVSVEDWYAITVAGPTQVQVTLSFESSQTADVDLYVAASGSRGLQILGQSVLDNPAKRVWNEALTISLPAAGTYYIGVDAFAAPGGRVPYQLAVE